MIIAMHDTLVMVIVIGILGLRGGYLMDVSRVFLRELRVKDRTVRMWTHLSIDDKLQRARIR